MPAHVEDQLAQWTPERRERVARAAAQRQQGVVVLEDIADPFNARAVFRSCDAFGIQRVCLIFIQEQPFDPRMSIKRVARGASKWLDFEIFRDTAECLGKLREEGYELWATALSEEAVPLPQARFTRPRTAIILGNEHHGLTKTALSFTHHQLTIPLVGMVQSLNLSVTAAICLAELTRQRLTLGMEQFLLPAAERARLAEDFLNR
jgi:tRNA (guanosine-2'-O-)-methyltransferase